MNIVIFGANGQTGRLLTGQALSAGHRVVAATRRPDDFPLSDPKLTVAAADVRDAAAVTEVVAGVDAVLSTLGVSFTREAVNTYSVGTGKYRRRDAILWRAAARGRELDRCLPHPAYGVSVDPEGI